MDVDLKTWGELLAKAMFRRHPYGIADQEEEDELRSIRVIPSEPLPCDDLGPRLWRIYRRAIDRANDE